MSQARADGGLGLGTTITSAIFLATILALVVYLAITKVDEVAAEGVPQRARTSPHEEHRILVVPNKATATPALVAAVRRRAAAGRARFFLLIPNPAHLAFDRISNPAPAEAELATALPVLKEPVGGEVEGRVASSPNAYDDIVDELSSTDYDEIILETPPH